MGAWSKESQSFIEPIRRSLIEVSVDIRAKKLVNDNISFAIQRWRVPKFQHNK